MITPPPSTPPPSTTGRPGLQPERTALAWQRTTLALLANGGLFVLRESGAPLVRIPSLVLSGSLLALAALVAAVGRRRERVLARHRLPSSLTPTWEVTVVGWAVVAACLGGVVVLALPGPA